MHLLSDTNTLPAFSLAKKMAEVILMVLVLLLSRADCQSEECLQLNDTTVLQKPLIPRVYMRPSTPTDQQPIMSSATLCWRIDDDDDDSECEETMNFNISNENNEWRELKIISTTLRDGDALTVVIMEDVVDVFEGNINKSTTADQPMQKGDVDEDVVLGKLMVNTSTNLIWAIDCHKVPIPMTPSEQGRTSSTSPPPPTTTTTTPHMTTATPNSTQEKTATDNNYNWKPLAIITLVILLLTLLCVVYRYVKDPMNKRRRNDSDNRSVANSIHNGKDMDIDSVEGGLHSSVSHSSNTAISTNNSISHDHNHRRSRLPSNATTYKGERKSVALHVDGNKNGNTMGRENSYMTKTIPATAAPPPPPPPVLKSIPPPPISSPLPRPSYAPPMPFDVAAKKDIDVNEDDEEHDYDYLDLNMLKVQMEKDKTEEKMRKMRLDSTMTRHSSENSLYETISITADQRKTPEELDMMQSKNMEEKEEKTNKMKKGETRCLVTYDSVNSLYEACFANSKEQTEDKVIKQDGGGDDDDDESEQEEQDEIQIKKRVEEESDNCSLPESSSQTEEGDISDAVDDNKQDENEGNDNENEDNDNKHDDDDRESENNNEDEDNDNKHDDDDRESENNNESDVSDDDNESESSHKSDVSKNVDQQEDIMNREGNSDNDEQNDEDDDDEEEKDNDHNIKETDNKVSESQAAESENINQKDMNGGEESIDTDEEEKKSKNDTDEIIKCSTKL